MVNNLRSFERSELERKDIESQTNVAEFNYIEDFKLCVCL